MSTSVPAALPSVGLFWGVPDGGRLHLVTAMTPLAEAEPYGDALTDPRGHYELWEGWQQLGAAHLKAQGLPVTILSYEYEDCPRGRVVCDARSRRFTLFADRKLQTLPVLAELKRLFGLTSEMVVVRSDPHYRSRIKIPAIRPE